MFYVSKDVLLRPLWPSDALVLRLTPGLEGMLSAGQAHKLVLLAQQATLPTLYLGVALRASSESQAIGVVGLKTSARQKDPLLVLEHWAENQPLRLLRQALSGILEIGFAGLQLKTVKVDDQLLAQLLGLEAPAMLTHPSWRKLCHPANKPRRQALMLLTNEDSVGLACP